MSAVNVCQIAAHFASIPMGPGRRKGVATGPPPPTTNGATPHLFFRLELEQRCHRPGESKRERKRERKKERKRKRGGKDEGKREIGGKEAKRQSEKGRKGEREKGRKGREKEREDESEKGSKRERKKERKEERENGIKGERKKERTEQMEKGRKRERNKGRKEERENGIKGERKKERKEQREKGTKRERIKERKEGRNPGARTLRSVRWPMESQCVYLLPATESPSKPPHHPTPPTRARRSATSHRPESLFGKHTHVRGGVRQDRRREKVRAKLRQHAAAGEHCRALGHCIRHVIARFDEPACVNKWPAGMGDRAPTRAVSTGAPHFG